MCIVAHGTRRSKQICCAASEFPRRHAPSLHALRIWNFFLRFNGGQRLDGLSERAVVRPMDRRPRRPRAHARAPSASGARPAVCSVPRAVRACSDLGGGAAAREQRREWRGSRQGAGSRRPCAKGRARVHLRMRACLGAVFVRRQCTEPPCFILHDLCDRVCASHPRSAPVHVARRRASGSP
jgi:hypothetical protein